MTSWQHAPAALWRRSGARVVVDVPDRPTPLVLTGPAAHAWTLLSEPTDESRLFHALAAHFGVPRTTVAEELPPVLTELVQAGALTCR